MITSEQLVEIFEKRNLLQTATMDAQYSLVDRDFIENFAESYNKSLRALGLSVYHSESNDCDKFAFAAYFLAHAAHAQNHTSTGLAMGIVCYDTDRGGGHAINFWVVKEDGEFKILFWEPQTQQIVTLSENEEASIFNVIV